MKKKVKFVFIIIAVVIMVGFLIYQNLKPLELELYRVEYATLTDSFREDGIVESDDKEFVYVPYDAKIKHIVKEGEFVKQGDILLEMDDTTLLMQKNQLQAQISALRGQQDLGISGVTDNQIEIAMIAIDSAKNTLHDADTNYKRLQELFEAGGVSKVELDQAESLYKDAKNNVQLKERQLLELYDSRKEKSGSKQYYDGQVDAITVQLNDLDNKLSKSIVYASTDGVVKSVRAKSGEYAQAIHPVMEVISPKNLIVRCDVLTDNVSALNIGQTIRIIQKTYAGDLEYEAKIIHIDDFATPKISSLGLDEQRVGVKAKLLGESKLKDGYNVSVEFDAFRKENILTIRKTSYFEEDGGYYVWKRSGSAIYKNEITLGYIGAYEVEVRSGLSENEQIVSDPNNIALKDGIRIKLNE